MKKNIIFLILMLNIALSSTADASSGSKTSDGRIWSRYGLEAGGFMTAIDSDVNFGVTGLGVTVDGEEALGLDDSMTVLRADGFWRFSSNMRHRFELGYFSLKREAEATLLEDVRFGDIEYKNGELVDTKLNLDIYKAMYSYSFFQDKRMDLAAGFGLYVTPLEFEIEGNGLVTERYEENILAPLPVFGLRGDFVITKRWKLRTGVDAFYLKLSNFKGNITNARVALEYQIFEHLSAGFGYESFNVEVESDSFSCPGLDFEGDFAFGYDGLKLYMKALF